ncbi:NaeI family type II restriction endonuclease [Streptomyces sp. NPDC050842]|uniref:NaeI family type II restriction endonuclease n=1 Tax=Streptomyces sp. NPDC050842 TaxID=3365636 RepID=UPI00379768C3
MADQLNTANDVELNLVAAELQAIDPDGDIVARFIREAFDQLLDGRRDGRFKYTDLNKVEKTFMGTLVEIKLQRGLGLESGSVTDYRIAGIEVDCKFSQKLNGWEIGPEIVGHICLVVTANDAESTWKVGLIRADESRLGAENRDKKRKLNPMGQASVKWLWGDHGRLAENQLLQISKSDPDRCDRIMHATGHYGRASGQARLLQLVQEVQGVALRRITIETVGHGLDDPMKRLRGNGGAREKLKQKGFLILGHQENDPLVARALNLPIPKKGEAVSVRVVPAPEPDDGRPVAEIEEGRWVIARHDEVEVVAPTIPRGKNAL